MFLLRGFVAGAGLLPWGLHLLGPHAETVRPLFRAMCHQLPERTLTIDTLPMLVCSRCAGIYAGMALGALLPGIPWLRSHGRWLVGMAAALMVVDVLLQGLGWYGPSHVSRLCTGVLVGWLGAAFLFSQPFPKTPKNPES